MDHVKIAYFDCFSGISGDMCLGAVVDAGVPVKTLERELKKIPVTGYRLSLKNVKRSGIQAKKIDVVLIDRGKKLKEMKWKDIENIIKKSRLSTEIKQKGFNIFQRIFLAEAKVHGQAFDTIHLHELGGIDCIIDIFGTIIGLNILGIDKIFSSPVNLGSGFVNTEHGILPVPAPATAEIIKKIPVYSKGISSELTTPTGAAIIKELSSGFGDIPLMDIEYVGIGAGNREFRDWPNVLRILTGVTSAHGDQTDEMVTVIETNIDDMSPQIFSYVMEKLYNAGALDVYFTQVIMKKGRPGVQLTVLCSDVQKDILMKIILSETSTIGLRFYEVKRKVLQRKIKILDTEFGKVRIKYSQLGESILKAVPEYEDCRRIATKCNIPLIKVLKKLEAQSK
jgi:uncharacterized protein (TIGR00299 family) protein